VGGPWLIANNNELIKPGMAFSIETMAGHPKLGRVKFEQDILVHEDHTEVITRCPDKPWL
jgi:Xaa-Pro aminopeptidase